MDEARAVLARLDRIEALEREGAPPGVLLEELRGLVQAAEAWARLEGDERAKEAVEHCESSLVGSEDFRPFRRTSSIRATLGSPSHR
jgi:hypothetical protein